MNPSEVDQSAFTHFRDRRHAGISLSKALQQYTGALDTLILALPRGGVPVAEEVAKALHLPLDVLLVRKLGVPGHDEIAMGAIAMAGVQVMNDEIVARFNVSDIAIDEVLAFETVELQRRNTLYRQNQLPPEVKGKTVIVVDDGLATGATMMAAVKALREMEVAKVVVACPVGAPATALKLNALADEVVCLHMPEPFYGVGQWYIDFSQTSDQEVLDCLVHTRRLENH